MNDGDLLAWIRYLHAAAAVSKGSPDYADAQAAVQHAVRKIRFLNRQANRADITTPDAYETARMSALANTAGDLAAAPVAPALTMTGGPGFAQLVGPPLEAFLSKIASKAALNARGVDVNAYERGMEAHPTATAVGEMVPPVLMALAGRLGAKPGMKSLARQSITESASPTTTAEGLWQRLLLSEPERDRAVRVAARLQRERLAVRPTTSAVGASQFGGPALDLPPGILNSGARPPIPGYTAAPESVVPNPFAVPKLADVLRAWLASRQ